MNWKKLTAAILILGLVMVFTPRRTYASAPTLVHFTASGPQSGSSSTISLTIPSTTAGDNLVVVCSSRDNPTSITFSDGTDTFTQQTGGIMVVQTNMKMDAASARNIAAGTTSVTCTISGNARDRSLMVWEIGGADTSASYIDVQGVLNNQADANPFGPSLTTTNADGFIVSAIIYDNQIAGGTGGGFTSDQIDTTSGLMGMAGGHRIVSATGTYQETWTNAAHFASFAIAIKGATSVATATPPKMIAYGAWRVTGAVRF